MKFAISCLGCKVNTFEAESILTNLKSQGYTEVSFDEVADIYIIFTCAVTNVASSKSRKKINQAIRQNKKAIICVVGCYVQLKPNELVENKDIDILVGSSHKEDLPIYISEVLLNKKRIEVIEDVRHKDLEFENLGVAKFDKNVRAFLKIQDGCNQFCSYCIIPYARGKERSMTKDKVIDLAKSLSLDHKEIVLSGIHTGRYRAEDVNLYRLMTSILESCEGLSRLRVSSIEVNEVSDEIITLMKEDTRMARHLHIPLQAGSDEILKTMNRPYTKEYFKSRMAYIRKHIPDISISTDLIVGFPNESDEMFEETLEFLKECEFSFIHVFPYSAKKGTRADLMENQVPADVKKKRVKVVSDLSDNLYYCFKGKFINKDMDVLIEKSGEDYSFGHSSEYIPVYVKGKYEKNSLIKVRGSLLHDDKLIAERM